MLRGAQIPNELEFGRGSVPARPNFNVTTMREESISVRGTGIWDSYFHPVSAFDFNHPSCTEKPLFQLSKSQVFPGIHYCASWAVRAWDYAHCAGTLEGWQSLHVASGKNESTHEWFGPQRRVVAHLVDKYFTPNAWLQSKIDTTNPRTKNDPPCLAIHIQLSDKAGAGRNRNLLETFLPYAEIFAKEGGNKIFVATDTSHNFDEIQKSWPPAIAESVVRQEGVFLSNSEQGVFDLVSHHRSNAEALVGIYSMAKCSLLVHGYSVMSEAVMYLNQSLHDFSVNLDLDLAKRKDTASSRSMVQKVLT